MNGRDVAVFCKCNALQCNAFGVKGLAGKREVPRPCSACGRLYSYMSCRRLYGDVWKENGAWRSGGL